jgi:hypothetical protein
MAMVLARIAPDRNPLLGEQLEVLVRQLSVRGKSQKNKKLKNGTESFIISILVAAIEITLSNCSTVKKTFLDLKSILV